MKLPPEFDLIELSAAQVGSSLTAVTALILLSDQGRRSLNEELHRPHEPRMWWKGFRRPPEVTSRLSTSYRSVRAERFRLHDLARTWLASQCSGVFASGERNTHPVIDMVVFEQLDLTSGEEPPAMREPLHAMALEGSPFDAYLSPQLPGAVIVPPRRSGRAVDEPTAWSVVGRRDALMAAEQESRSRDGEPSLGSLLFDADYPVQALLLHVAVLDFLILLQDRYVHSRDSAHHLHQRFSASRVERFRSELLSFGLDLTAVVRDSATLWRDSERQWDGIDVMTRAKKDSTRRERDVIANMGKARKRIARELVTDFAAYRDVVTATAALGSTASATRNGRLALLVAVASLLVACGALVGRSDLGALIERCVGLLNGV